MASTPSKDHKRREREQEDVQASSPRGSESRQEGPLHSLPKKLPRKPLKKSKPNSMPSLKLSSPRRQAEAEAEAAKKAGKSNHGVSVARPTAQLKPVITHNTAHTGLAAQSLDAPNGRSHL